MHIKTRIFIVMCLIKSLYLFEVDYNDEMYDDRNNSSVLSSSTDMTTMITDNPKSLKGVCEMKYFDRRFRRVTYVKTHQRTYLAECCGGLRNCTRSKKLYRFSEDYKDLKPVQKYHQICCRGYERDYAEPFLPGGNIKCTAVCDPPCARGTCIAPQKCTCDKGFVPNLDKKNECVDGCLSKCENATCVDFKMCECDFGFASKDEEYCEPICPGGCTNGDCYLPFQCKCHEGYDKDPFDPYLCYPVCTNGCGNGTCIKPEICKCVAGDEYSPEFKTCVPSCTRDCGKGLCVPPPKMCECPRNYVYSEKNNTCIAVCNQPCNGGTCIAPNECLCFRNYYKAPGEFGCREKCNGECGYGKCQPDGTCLCEEKLYVMNRNGTSCRPRADNCFETGGTVLAPWLCKCPKGKQYIKPTPEQSDEGYNATQRYCLPSKEPNLKLEKCLETYKDVSIEP